MRSVRIVLGIVLALQTQSVVAQCEERSVVPIRRVEITPDGTPRFTIPVTVGGVTLETGFDTGSSGLRLLPRAVRRSSVVETDKGQLYGYGSGVTLRGPVALGRVRIGATEATIELQAVREVGCRKVNGEATDCPANKVSPDDYGLMGGGSPGQGFDAIIGVRVQPSEQPNPLVALGVRRWLVHLPRLGESDGALILNPDARDTEGFSPLRAATNAKGERDGSVAGCLMLAREGAVRICGPTLWDTGAAGIRVLNSQRPPAWMRGVKARMGFATAAGGRPVAVGFRTGDPGQRTFTTFAPDKRRPGVSISAGQMPYYAYDALYDAGRGEMAVRARTGAPGGPVALP